MFTIEKNVPIPPHGRGEGTGLKAALESMKIGDSLFCPLEGRSYEAIVRAGYAAAKSFGGRSVTRRVTENGVEGVRVWRVE